MSLRLFEGPAGSGKTTALFGTLASTLIARPLLPHEKVLALTKMHGSRRRMQGRLDSIAGLRGRFSCKTIDSFAWRILRRWRQLARVRGWKETAETDYSEVCACAGELLNDPVVGGWATRGFPIVVVDELQDSQGGQLQIIRALAATGVCLAAADEFQDLDAAGDNAAVAWARTHGTTIALSTNHRTNAPGLLAAADAIRRGQTVPSKGEGFTILGAMRANVGASYLSKNLTWWKSSADIAIITPVGPVASAFVREVIDRVQEGPIGTPATGPHRIVWEASQEEECEMFLSSLGLPENSAAGLCASDLRLNAQDVSSIALQSWLDQQRTIGGRTRFRVEELKDRARAIHQRSRAHRRVRESGVRVLTVHQAKNREFDSVIVLWPYEVKGSSERKRKLLYNAITRAKRRALVIVQNPERLIQAPFISG